MTGAPNRSLVERATRELQEAYPHSFRFRSDAEDAVRIALNACRTEELLASLRKLRSEYGKHHTVCGRTLIEVDNLLAELDGKPSGGAV